MSAWPRFKTAMMTAWDIFVERLRIPLIFSAGVLVVSYLAILLPGMIFGEIPTTDFSAFVAAQPVGARTAFYAALAGCVLLLIFIVAATWAMIKDALEEQSSSARDFVLGGFKAFVPTLLVVTLTFGIGGGAIYGASAYFRQAGDFDALAREYDEYFQEVDRLRREHEVRNPRPEPASEPDAPGLPRGAAAVAEAPTPDAAPALDLSSIPRPEMTTRQITYYIILRLLAALIPILALSFQMFYLTLAVPLERGWLASFREAARFVVKNPTLTLFFIILFLAASVSLSVLGGILIRYIPPLAVFAGCFMLVYLYFTAALIVGGNAFMRFLEP